MTDQITLLEFPCRYPIKAFGKAESSFEDLVVALVSEHTDSIVPDEVEVRASNGGKYTAVTVYITAESAEQLTAISKDLVDHPSVIMAL